MKNIRLITGVVAALALAAQVNAGFVDITGGFNVLTFGDFYDENDQIHGKVAAGGNATIENSFGVNVDAPLNNTLEAIVSGGDVSVSGNGQVHGTIYAAGDALVSSATVTGDVYAQNITMQNYDVRGTMYYTNSVSTPHGTTQRIGSLPDSPVDFAAKKADALALSNQLTMFSTGSYTIESGVLNLSEDLYSETSYFSISASDFENVSDLYVDNLDKKYVVNVIGAGSDDITLNNINQKNYGTNTDLNYGNMLFNFVDIANLEIGSFYGNLLATNVDVTAQDGQMFGYFVANSFSGKYEFHQIEPPTNVAEPSSMTMIAAGLVCLAAATRKKFALKK